MNDSIRLEVEDGVAYITLCRPEAANVLNLPMIAALREAVGVASQSRPQVVVFRGKGGKAFSGGADLKERRQMNHGETRAFLGELATLLGEIESFEALTIAAIDGVALGGGLELALACDLRVVTSRSQLGLTEVRLGIIPGAGGTQRLPRLIGLARAKEMILLGRRISAVEAGAWGLATAVVQPEGLDQAIRDLVGEAKSCAPLAIVQAKRAMMGGQGLPLDQALTLERHAYDVTLSSHDRDEGLKAFAEKRKPNFEGR